MKIVVFIAFFAVYSCKSTSENSLSQKKTISNSECPSDGTCSFKTSYDKSFTLIKDEFGNAYPKFIDDESILLTFTYKRNEIPNTADGGYEEIIYIQLDRNNLELNLKDKELKNVNLTFARLCFCRGATGYYSIDSGHLSIKKVDKKTYQVNLSFKAQEVPQIINEISETFVVDK